MGFDVAASQCLVAPPYVLAAIVMFTFAYYGDKWHIRSPFIIFNGCLCLLGLGLLGYVENVGVRYVSQVTSCTIIDPEHLLTCTTTVRRLPRHQRLQCQRPLRSHLASQQHPWPVEACSLLCHACRLRRYWWHHWRNRLPRAGQTILPTRYLDVHDCLLFDRAHYGGDAI